MVSEEKISLRGTQGPYPEVPRKLIFSSEEGGIATSKFKLLNKEVNSFYYSIFGDEYEESVVF
jgi:hypothetical protein